MLINELPDQLTFDELELFIEDLHFEVEDFDRNHVIAFCSQFPELYSISNSPQIALRDSLAQVENFLYTIYGFIPS